MLDWKNMEYLGHNIKIENATDESKIGMKGFVIYQTKEKIILRLKNKIKTIKLAEIIEIEKE